MNGVRAVIFDMDGVLIDSEPLHERAFVDVLRRFGYEELPGIRFEDFLGQTDRAVWEAILSRIQLPASLEQLLKMKRTRVLELIETHRPLASWATSLSTSSFSGVPIGACLRICTRSD